MHLRAVLFLGLLLPACGSTSSPTAAGKSAAVAAPVASVTPSTPALFPPGSRDDPSCISPSPPPDGPISGGIEQSDPHFPSTSYPFCVQVDDHIPWQPNGVPFSQTRNYTQQEQLIVTESEKRIFNAEEHWVTQRGAQTKELKIVHPDHRDAASPPPGSESFIDEASAPSAVPTSSASSGLSNRFGNRLFGAGYDGTTRHNLQRSGNNATSTIVSDARVFAEVFHWGLDVVRFLVTADCVCDLRNISAPPQRRGVSLNYFRGGTLVPVAPWTPPVRLNGQLPEINRRFFGARQRFMVGPVPMMVEAGVVGNTSLDVNIDPQCPQITANITPRARLFVTSSWAIDVRIIRAGIRANLSLLDLTMPMEAHMGLQASPTNACANWHANLQRVAQTLNGEIELFTTVRFLFFQEHYSLTIARWNGIELRNRFNERQGQICAN